MTNLYYEEIKTIFTICNYFKSSITANLDKNFQIYIKINGIYVIDKKNFLYKEDIGRGETYGLACLNLIRLYLDKDNLIRFNNNYATFTVRKLIKENYLGNVL
jgi:hypothetical protein